MGIPDYQSLMLPVLHLAAAGESRVADVAERIANDLGLTEDEREQLLPSGRQRLLHNRIHWAKFYMTKAGLILSPARGRFVASERGRALLATKPSRVDVSTLMAEPGFREFYRNEGAVETGTLVLRLQEQLRLQRSPLRSRLTLHMPRSLPHCEPIFWIGSSSTAQPFSNS